MDVPDLGHPDMKVHCISFPIARLADQYRTERNQITARLKRQENHLPFVLLGLERVGIHAGWLEQKMAVIKRCKCYQLRFQATTRFVETIR